LDPDHEIILVDDGSRDDSWQILVALHGENHRIKIVRLAKNYGQHNALMCGLRHCSGSYVITLDDDLQDLPEEIPKLIQAIQSNKDLDAVCGRPLYGQYPFLKKMASHLLHRVENAIFKSSRALYVSSFKVIRSGVVRRIIEDKSPHPVIGHLLLRATRRVKNVDVSRERRRFGRTGYGFRKIMSLGWNMALPFFRNSTDAGHKAPPGCQYMIETRLGFDEKVLERSFA
jgi:glycosyltransferase involved in cell wall biosynthesis